MWFSFRFAAGRLADDRDRRLWLAAFVTLKVNLAVAFDLDLAPFGKRVDGADAHPVQPARHLVSSTAEFPARVQDGHHHLKRRLFLFRVHIDRDTPAVVFHHHAFSYG